MFVAWRELRTARGRFALIAAVVALITVLVGFLAGLTGGLAAQNVSAVLDLPGDRLVLDADEDGERVAFGESAIDADALAAWRNADGVDSADPVGIAQSRMLAGEERTGVAVFGAEPGVLPQVPADAGEVTLSAEAAESLGVQAGDVVRIAGLDLDVARVVDDAWYAHTPVVWVGADDWATVTAGQVPDGTVGTVLVATGDADWASVDATAGTASDAPLGALTAIESFRSEIGSLGLMLVMLYGISALVVGAFFVVWTIQRLPGIAVQKALGATTGSLVRGTLGQAAIVLAIGVGAGILVVVGAGALAGSALPFLLSPLTTLVPAAALVVLGLAGAAVSLRPVLTADPLLALGSTR